MPLVQIPVGIAPFQVDDFPKEVVVGKDDKGKDETRKFERSVEGALYLRPASTKNLTDDEWGHLKKKYKVLARAHVVKVDVTKARSLKKPKPKAPTSSKPTAATSSDARKKADDKPK